MAANAEYTCGTMIVSATVVAYDIGERVAEEALKASEENIVSSYFAPAGIYEVDFTTGRFVRVTAYLRIHRLCEEELLNGDAQHPHRGEPAPFPRKARKINRGESVPMNPEFCMRNRDGSTWVQLNVEFIRKEAVTGVTLWRTTSVNGKLEDALRESEERYALIANNVADTITIMDLDLNVHYASSPIAPARLYRR